MGDEDWLNLYGWWTADQSPKVAVVSCAGFEELEPKGPETDRVIANDVVSVLAGFFGNLDTHAGGKQNCPLAFNQSREWKYVAGNLEFDARCRAKVKGLHHGAAQLRAMENLLKLFKE